MYFGFCSFIPFCSLQTHTNFEQSLEGNTVALLLEKKVHRELNDTELTKLFLDLIMKPKKEKLEEDKSTTKRNVLSSSSSSELPIPRAVPTELNMMDIDRYDNTEGFSFGRGSGDSNLDVLLQFLYLQYSFLLSKQLVQQSKLVVKI